MADVDFVGYIDADCFFLDDISLMLREIPIDKDFAIHEHRFSKDRSEWLPRSGRFNVGIVVGRPAESFKKCIANWRLQVLERCDVDMNNGRCGDQTYLNDWPRLFPELHIFNNPGAGVAPWNLNNYVVSEHGGQVYVDDWPVYFFHFHGLQIRYLGNRSALYIAASGYNLAYIPKEEIYRPYLSSLLSKRILSKSGDIPKSSNHNSIWLIRGILKGRINFISTQNFRTIAFVRGSNVG